MALIIEKWCQPGNDRYSIELLEQLEPYQKSLMEVAEENKDKKGKEIPCRMIINHFTQEYPLIKTLLGPYQINYMVGNTPCGTLRIYNLHDFHAEPRCSGPYPMRANTWILEILKSADVFVDLFIESSPPDLKGFYEEGPYSKMPPLPVDGYGTMVSLILQLDKCIREKTSCPVPNARIHGINVRVMGNALRYHIAQMYPEPPLTSEGKLPDVPDEVMIKLKYMAETIINSKKMKKQLRDCPECICDQFSTDNINKKITFAVSQSNRYQIYKDRVNWIYVTVGGIIMDVYFLGRLFRKFDTSKERGKPDRVQNAIIYSGGAHAVTYESILNDCGFKTIFSKGSRRVEGPQSQCLDIFDIPRPFFR
jgi:hypothetical protein